MIDEEPTDPAKTILEDGATDSPKGDGKGVRIRANVTDAERLWVKEAADRVGLTISDFIRSKVLAADTAVPTGIVPDAFHDLDARIKQLEAVAAALSNATLLQPAQLDNCSPMLTMHSSAPANDQSASSIQVQMKGTPTLEHCVPDIEIKIAEPVPSNRNFNRDFWIVGTALSLCLIFCCSIYYFRTIA
jgi:hypothetical protein